MFEIVRANQRKAIALVVFMALLLFTLGYSLGELVAPGFGAVGLVGAFILWIILTMISYYSGGDILLSISRARKIQKQDHPVLHNVVEEMTIAAGMPKVPDIYIIDDPSPNAFATGRDPEHAVVAVTSGLLEIMSRDELQGVIGHELGHVANRDILYMTMVGVMMGAIILLADVGRRHLFWGGPTRSRRSSRDGGNAQLVILVLAIVLIILAPVIAQLIYMAVSRRREYLADASSAIYTRYPEGLASALEKLGSSTTKLKVANPATAPMYIVNPLAMTASGLSDLTSTHPPISERVRILRSMGSSFQMGDYNEAFRRVTGRPVGVVPFVATSAKSEPAQPRPAPAAGDSHIERVRQVTDALWRLDQYAFIACACDTQLKIPPVYQGKKIECPHCGRLHTAARDAG